MEKRTNVLLIFGGQSGEHEVSVVSADSVIKALDINKYHVESIGITKDGLWYWGVKPEDWKGEKGPSARILPHHQLVTIVLNPQDPHFMALDGSTLPNEGRFDIIFPVMHGPKGEDGTIQGLLEMAGAAYVGSGVLGSSLGMDKDRMKAVFQEAGLPIVKHMTILRDELADLQGMVGEISGTIGYPCFVKPANLGSSVGISKAENHEQLAVALEYAARFDRKIVVEEGVKAREIELSVLGNDFPKASVPGEIVPGKDFYDYDAKYNDSSSRLFIPAQLSSTVVSTLQEYACRAFLAVGASGLGRVDFFVSEKEEIYVNEINTMPGFTQISMYPKLWEASGLAYTDLLDELIRLGLERFRDK